MNIHRQNFDQHWLYIRDCAYSCAMVFGCVLISPAIAYLIWIA